MADAWPDPGGSIATPRMLVDKRKTIKRAATLTRVSTKILRVFMGVVA
jgi:hypothetical protein